MKSLLAAMFTCLAAGTALADSIDTNSIVAAITGDWNKDSQNDLALLTRGGEDGMDLRFFLNDASGRYLNDAGAALGKVWGRAEPDGISGQEPGLIAMPNGSIQVITHNDSIGRDRWSQTLTLALRNTDFVVAGFTYSYYDTIDNDNSGSCDINVLTGKGVAEKPDSKGGTIKLKISLTPEFTPFKDWTEETVMKACGISV